MASAQARMGQQALAVLDVVLRVPCIFIIDAIFNSYYEPGSGWTAAPWKVLLRVLGKCDKVGELQTGIPKFCQQDASSRPKANG